jgi:aspartyl-tRNA(Asn)/glutamyl-tRNA(Gln) amidotransferase subunit B
MEIHVQLATRSKMFTGTANGFSAEPNSQVDPQVLGLPGTLPVINRKAVEFTIKTGLALNCKISGHTKWDRKSYYYPDLPKNYQISQYDLPLCYEGAFAIAAEDGSPLTVRIRRAHLEEDAGKLLHEAPGGYHIDWSIVDLNRAGMPLMEIVTEPDLHSAADVRIFGQALQQLVQYLGVSHAQMQLGQMRFEPNINVHITDQDGVVHKTAITEIKNLNSFSVLERATAYEISRQIRQWEETGSLGKKSTMGWNEEVGATFWQRDKEQEHDYRYFPDPDLPPVEVDQKWLAELKTQIGELPAARRKRYIEELSLKEADAGILSLDRETGDFFEAILAAGAEPARASTLMEAMREMSNERVIPLRELGLAPARVAEVAALVRQNKIAASKETAKSILALAAHENLSAEAAAGKLGLLQVSDTGPIDAAIAALIAANPRPLQDYRAGKASALGALVGMILKNAKGLNPKLVQERLREALK